MYTVREDDLYIGYRFKVQAVMKDGSIRTIPPSSLTWRTCGTIQVHDGKVTYLGEKGDKVIAQVLNKQQQVIASDCIYITDEYDLYEDWEFGVSGLSYEDDSKIKRIKDSKNKDYLIDFVSGRIVTDFDGIIDFVRAKDEDGNEFVKIPTLYRKFNGDQLIISKYQKDEDYKVYPCFIDPQTGAILEEIAIGAYKSGINEDGNITTQSRVDRVNKTLQYWKSHTAGPNPYHNYFLRNEAVNQLLRDLFVVVFAARSLSQIMKDQNGADSSEDTGTTDGIIDLVFSYPQNCCGYNFQKRSFKLFGIEDPFNGGAEWINGLQNVPELSRDDSCCLMLDDNDGTEVDDYLQLKVNNQNVKTLALTQFHNAFYIMPKETTCAVSGYYDNSIFHMNTEAHDIINSIPHYIKGNKYTGLWTYFAVNGEETEAYSRLCYYDEGDKV